MQLFFVVGAVAGWLLVSLISGRLLPVLCLPTIIAVFIGGIIGQFVGFALAGGTGQGEDSSESTSVSEEGNKTVTKKGSKTTYKHK